MYRREGHRLRYLSGLRDFDRPHDLLHLAGNIFFVQTEQAGVLAGEALGKNAAWKLIVLIVLDGLEKAHRDLQFP